MREEGKFKLALSTGEETGTPGRKVSLGGREGEFRNPRGAMSNGWLCRKGAREGTQRISQRRLQE